MQNAELFDRDALVAHLRQQQQEPEQPETQEIDQGAPFTMSREERRAADDRQRAERAFQQLAEIRRTSGPARAEILRGIQRAEPLASLLLTACRSIATMTGDAAFAERAAADILTVYGKGLQQPEALTTEAEQCERRAALLAERLDAAPLTDDEKDTLRRSIRAHQARAAEIRRTAR